MSQAHDYADLDNVYYDRQEYHVVPSLSAPPYSGGSPDVCYILVRAPTTAFSMPPTHDHRP